MGTSVSQSSPHTLSWNAAHAAYRDANIPVSRVAAEVWRAALNQESGDIGRLIAHPIIAQIGMLATEATSASDLSRKTALLLVHRKQSSLGTEIARRAAIQCVGAPNQQELFRERVFAEATGYLVARDLSGFVGGGRTHNVAESLDLKAALMSHVANVVRSVRPPRALEAKSWAEHVSTVVDELRRIRR
jgi:hypothetical protein